MRRDITPDLECYTPRSPYCVIRSILERTLIWGSPSCNMVRNESNSTET